MNRSLPANDSSPYVLDSKSPELDEKRLTWAVKAGISFGNFDILTSLLIIVHYGRMVQVLRGSMLLRSQHAGQEEPLLHAGASFGSYPVSSSSAGAPMM